MITIKLKDRKWCNNKKWFGQTLWIKKDKVEIIVSSEKNKNPAEFFVTVLHELLHVWVAIMKMNGLILKKEHLFIYTVEHDIVRRFRQLCGGKHK